jgi:hypothetical protein
VTDLFGRIGVVLVSLAVSCARPGPAPLTEVAGGAPVNAVTPRPLPEIPFEVHSEIPDCVTVTAAGGRTMGNLLLGAVHVETRKIIADCVCPSKWLLYRAIRSFHGYHSEQASGILLAPDPESPGRDLDVVLQADKDHPEAGSLTVVLDCRPPL